MVTALGKEKHADETRVRFQKSEAEINIWWFQLKITRSLLDYNFCSAEVAINIIKFLRGPNFSYL